MPRRILLLTACAAGVWIAWRAATQSITIDEATTYLVFASRDFAGVFVPANNNHLLNTLLMWLATHVCGLSHLALRAGALLGAAIYLASAVALVHRLGGGLMVEWPLLACLVFNPVIGDFLVAARGYGLAAGFLLAGLAAAGIERVRLRCVVCSVCAGLSFVASFSFAFAAAAMLAVLFFQRLERRLLWSLVPGLAVVALVAGWTLAHWPAGELWFGSHSVGEMVRWICEPSLTRADPGLIGIPAFRAFEAVKPWVFPVAGVVLLLCLPRLDAPGRLYAWILGLTLAVHLAAFYLAGLLLPRERTGLFLIPLVTLLAGAAARVERRVMPGVLCLFAVLYLVCLRTSYFREWRWNASVGEAYAVVHRWEQHGCARETGAGWRYVSSLAVYRHMHGEADRVVFEDVTKSGRRPDLYILHPEFDAALVTARGLQVIFSRPENELLVAATPAADACAAGQNWK